MPSNNAFKKQVRAYAAEHGLKYADAYRRLTEQGHGPAASSAVVSLRQRSYTAKITEPANRPVWLIQPGEFDNGVLPYELGLQPGGDCFRQDYFRGKISGIHGVVPDADNRIDLTPWSEWFFDSEEDVRQRLLGQFLVVRTGDSDLWLGNGDGQYGRSYNLAQHGGGILSVEKRVLGPLAPVTAYFEQTEEYASDWARFVNERYADHPDRAALRSGFTFDVASWIGLLTDEHMREARDDAWEHPAINHFLYLARGRFEIPYGTTPTAEQIAEWGLDPDHPAVAAAEWAENRTETFWNESAEAEQEMEPFVIRLDPDQVEGHLSSESTGTYRAQMRRTLRVTVQATGLGDGSAGDVEEVATIRADTLSIGKIGLLDLLSLRWRRWSMACRLDGEALGQIAGMDRDAAREGDLGTLRDLHTPDSAVVRLLAAVASASVDFGDADRQRLLDSLRRVASNPRAEVVLAVDPDEFEAWFDQWAAGHGCAAQRGAQDIARVVIRNAKSEGLDHFASGVFWALYSPGWLHHPERRGAVGALTTQARDYLRPSGIGAVLSGWDDAPDLNAKYALFDEAWEQLQQQRPPLFTAMADLVDEADKVGRA